MEKLTAEKCREQFEVWGASSRCELSKWVRGDRAGEYKNPVVEKMWQAWQASRDSLPILEQQDHEKSIIAGQLEAVRDSLSLTPHQDAVISCAIDRLNVLTLRTLELSRSLITQQGQGDGWIEWRGGVCPVDGDTMVVVKFRDGSMHNKPRPALIYRWTSEQCNGDIIAYRVVNP